MLSKTIKLAIKTVAVASAAGYIALDQYETKRAGEFVVMRDVNSRASWARADVRSAAKKVGTLVRETENSFVVKTTKGGADSLKRPGLIIEPVIAYGVPKPPKAKGFMSCDGPAPKPTPPPPPPGPSEEVEDWGVARVHSAAAYAKGNYAKGIKVCVLDTGVATNHPDLMISGGKNFSDSGPATDYEDRQGHGTHTAGLVAAVLGNGIGVIGASQAQIYEGKVLADDGYGYNDWIAEGMIWSVNLGCQVISMSLGGPERSAVLESAIVYAQTKGVKIFAAAGNESSNFVGYPAGYVYPGTLFSVSATDSTDEIAWFSNFGKVEMTCPGVDILSTVPGGYDRYSGTSMATPICAGVAALYIAAGKEIQYEEMGSPIFFGRGMPDARGAVR